MKLLDLLKKSDTPFKKNIAFFFFAYFLVLFNYPLIRASSTTFFLEAFGAKSSPTAWLWSVLFLSITIFICSKLQARYTVQKVFIFVSLLSAALFIAGTLGLMNSIKWLAFVPFIWKEIYIVLQVHLMLAYANNFFSKEDFKIILGPVGAAGSLGGILGGLLTSYLSSLSGTTSVMFVGVGFVVMPAILFLFTSSRKTEEVEKQVAPLESLNDPKIRQYVFYIACMVVLTQFIINIADFKFNLVFEKGILDSGARTSYLGDVYTVTNGLTFFFQFILVPFVLPRVSEKNYHLFIPCSYLICLLIYLVQGGLGLLPIAALYIYFKASDYSLFSAGKEILYQPLAKNQKYGAKYFTDMFVYRLSKALIAAVLIYLQTSFILDMMMSLFLLIWLGLVFKLFKLHRKTFPQRTI